MDSDSDHTQQLVRFVMGLDEPYAVAAEYTPIHAEQLRTQYLSPDMGNDRDTKT
jgi:hypothetical protein